MQNHKIDVVIPAHEKDIEVLDKSIASLEKCSNNINRIIVVSDKKLTRKAEWFPESNFPFSKKDIENELNKLKLPYKIYPGWFYQIMMKIYAVLVIKDLAEHFLIMDSDVIWIKKIDFFSDDGRSLLSIGLDPDNSYNNSIFKISGVIDRYPNCNSVAHHMMVDKSIMKKLIEKISRKGEPLWKTLLREEKTSCTYNLYFKYAINKFPQKVAIRPLPFINTGNIAYNKDNPDCPYMYLACHKFRREDRKLKRNSINDSTGPPEYFRKKIQKVTFFESLLRAIIGTLKIKKRKIYMQSQFQKQN